MEQYRTNWFRAAALLYGTGTKAKQKLLQHYLDKKNMNLQTFIEANQHDIYHLYSNECCQCSSKQPKHPTTKVLNATQMAIMFAKSCKRCNTKRRQSSDPFCCSTFKMGTHVEDFDITLLHIILGHICLQLFWDCVLRVQGKTFQQFLVENQHSIFHLWKFNISKCCSKSCHVTSTKGKITESQWLTLYPRNAQSSPCNTGLQCFCLYSVNTTLVENQLDKSTAMTLQKCFCRLRLAVENLVKNRNTLAHKPDCQLSDRDLNELWSDVKDDVICIFGYICKESETDVTEEIDMMKEIDLLKTGPLEQNPILNMVAGMNLVNLCCIFIFYAYNDNYMLHNSIFREAKHSL